MTEDELHDLFEANGGFFLENPDPGRTDLNAFNYLAKLVPGTKDIVSCAEHDEIWLGVDPKDLAAVATEEDVIYLIRHGVMFEYGSGFRMYT